jgi:hypothetical protein
MNRADIPGELRPGDVVTIPDRQDRQEDGATEQRHDFRVRAKLASIRFVHGSPNLPYRQDPTLTVLNVSNYIANRAGTPDGDHAFPAAGVRRFDADGHADVDTFKIEIEDIRGAGTLKVDLELLRPIYVRNVVVRHEKFPAAIAAARKLDQIDAVPQGSSKCFRTSYLKLVVDDADIAAAPNQLLLASDMHAAGDSKVEILDQVVKASYTITSCPQNPKCRISSTVPIGTDRKRIKLAVHILRQAPGGAPIVSIADVEKRLFTWFRRVYAQASIAPKLMQPVREIDPPENLVAISDDHGAVAVGNEQLGFRINAAGHPSQVIGPFTPAAGARPQATANALAALVRAPFRATVSRNAARLDAVSDDDRSADIIITAVDGARVTLDLPVTGAAGQTLAIGRVNPLNIPRAPFNFSGLIGTIEQRTLFKNFDTGDDRVDVFVCQQLTPNVRGTATISGHRVNANRRTATKVTCSVLMIQSTIDGTDANPFTFPHEFGHVAGETGHAQAAPAQMMAGGGTTAANAIGATKRIRDGAVTYDLVAGSFNLVARIRAESANLLENW